MSRVVSFSAVIPVVTKLLWVASVVLGASSATATAESQSVRHLPRAATEDLAAFRYTPPVADGKVDVFLDLACPDSAAAWPTIKQVVWEYGFRTEFVFHILAASQNQVAFQAAKAVQVVRKHSTGSDEVVLFIDDILDHQNLLIMPESDHEANDDMTRLEFFDIVVSGALAGGSVTEDQFKRGMQDPQVDRLVRNELEATVSQGVYATPTVLLNGIFTMHLVGTQTLQDFQLFVGRGMSPKPVVVSYDVTREVWRAPVEGNEIGEDGTDYDGSDDYYDEEEGADYDDDEEEEGTDYDDGDDYDYGYVDVGLSAASTSPEKSGDFRQNNVFSAIQ